MSVTATPTKAYHSMLQYLVVMGCLCNWWTHLFSVYRAALRLAVVWPRQRGAGLGRERQGCLLHIRIRCCQQIPKSTRSRSYMPSSSGNSRLTIYSQSCPSCHSFNNIHCCRKNIRITYQLIDLISYSCIFIKNPHQTDVGACIWTFITCKTVLTESK